MWRPTCRSFASYMLMLNITDYMISKKSGAQRESLLRLPLKRFKIFFKMLNNLVYFINFVFIMKTSNRSSFDPHGKIFI